MANIQQAAKWMEQGKRVESFSARRSSGIYAYEGTGDFFSANSGVRIKITLDDLLADDWELAEEKHD